MVLATKHRVDFSKKKKKNPWLIVLIQVFSFYTSRDSYSRVYLTTARTRAFEQLIYYHYIRYTRRVLAGSFSI